MSRPRRWLLRLAVLIAVPLLALTVLVGTTWGLKRSLSVARALSPVAIEARDPEGSLLGGFSMASLELRGAGWSVTLDRLVVDPAPGALLARRLRLERLAAREITVTTRPDAPAQPPPPAATPGGWPKLDLPLAVHIDTLAVDRIEVAGQVVEALAFEGALAAGRLDVTHLSARVPAAELSLSGFVDTQADYRHALALAAGLAGGTVELTAEGALASTRVTALSRPEGVALDLTLDDLAAGLSYAGEVALSAGALVPAPDVLALDFSGDLRGARFAGQVEAGGERVRLSGGTLAWSEEGLRLDGLSLALSGRPVQVDATAELAATGAWSASLDLDAELGSLPLAGRLDAAGEAATYRLDGAGTLAGQRWSVAGSGDADGLSDLHLDLTAAPGALEASGAVQWSPALAWQARIDARDLDPGVWLPEWPGRVAFSGQASGRGGTFELSIPTIDGVLRGQAFAGQLHVAGTPAALAPLSLELASADDRLAVRGRWRPGAPELEARLAVVDLGQWLPGAAGAVEAQARTVGDGLMLSGAVRDLALEDLAVTEARFDGQLALAPEADTALDLSVSGADAAGIPLRALTATLEGPAAALRVRLEADLASLGALDSRSTLDLVSRPRAARLDALGLQHPDFGGWNLAEPVTLRYGEGVVELPESCFGGAGGRACLAADLAPGAAGRATIDLQGLSLGLFESPAAVALGRPLELSGTVGGRIDVETAGLSWSAIDAGISGREVAVISDDLGPATELRLDTLAVTLRGDAARLEVGADGEGPTVSLELRGAVVDPLVALRSLEDTRLAFALPDLAALEGLAPGIAELAGSARGVFEVSGPLNGPEISGRATVSELAFRSPELGTGVEGGRLELEILPAGDARLEASLPVGDAELRIDGTATPPTAGPFQARLSVTGQAVPLADTPDLTLVSSPDLTLQMDSAGARLRGTVAIDRARITTPTGTAAVQPSPDVRVITEASTRDDAAPGWALETEIAVVLGEDVRFEGMGLEADLAGRLLLVDRPQARPLASGEINVTGSYRAWGQNLRIEQGRLLYAGTPLDNPALNLVAVRPLDEVRVGVQVTGTARAPELEVFSRPPMDQSRALAYLLLGRPLEQTSSSESDALTNAALALALKRSADPSAAFGARLGFDEFSFAMREELGGAALAIGRYLSPDLFVRYTVGLQAATDLLELNYRLSRRLSLEARVGEETRGALRYATERNRGAR